MIITLLSQMDTMLLLQIGRDHFSLDYVISPGLGFRS